MSSFNVLVIQHRPEEMQPYVEHLRRLGLKVTFARTGLEGLDRANRTRPDLILIGEDLSKMNPIRYCHILKSNVRTKEIPIIVMISGDMCLQDRQRLMQIGVEGIMVDPSPEALTDRARALLSVGNEGRNR